MNGEYVILPKGRLGFRLGKGQCMRVVDVEGQQVADVMAYHEKDFYEKFDQGATMDSLFSSKVKKGDKLYSNLYKPMFTIIEDTVECHDLYMPACRQEMYQLLYGRTHLEVMHTCYDNLRTAFEPFGIPKEDMYYPFNAFMNTVIDEKGKLSVELPKSLPGDYIRLRAEMDLIVAVSACPADIGMCNGSSCTSIRVEID
ncbi:urea carboxylase-associated family protein [Bacillus safensis]